MLQLLSDIKLEVNPVAGVLALLRNMVQNCLVNQDSLVRTNSVAVLGALLQKVCPLSLLYQNQTSNSVLGLGNI